MSSNIKVYTVVEVVEVATAEVEVHSVVDLLEEEVLETIVAGDHMATFHSRGIYLDMPPSLRINSKTGSLHTPANHRSETMLQRLQTIIHPSRDHKHPRQCPASVL